MNRIVKSLVLKPLDTFAGMPQASLAKLMREVGGEKIRGFWKSFAKPEHFECTERDCRVISRLEFGRFAWLVGIAGSYLVEVGRFHWGRDRFGNSLSIETTPPVCLGKDRELGFQFLVNVAGSNFCMTGAYFLIDTWEKKDNRVREISCYELAGRAASHDSWVSQSFDSREERSREIWTRMRPDVYSRATAV